MLQRILICAAMAAPLALLPLGTAQATTKGRAQITASGNDITVTFANVRTDSGATESECHLFIVREGGTPGVPGESGHLYVPVPTSGAATATAHSIPNGVWRMWAGCTERPSSVFYQLSDNVWNALPAWTPWPSVNIAVYRALHPLGLVAAPG